VPEPLLTPEATATPEVDDEAWLDPAMAAMTTADKVGQLFLVPFFGGVDEAGAGSDIAYLVQALRVGGVILAPENENIRNDSSAPQQVLSLLR